MNYIGAPTVIALLLPPLLILLHNIWSGRRSSNALDEIDNASPQSDYNALPSLPIGEYEVFLSFRGPDTRHQITDILYHFLVHLKIRTFKDDDDLRMGEGIWLSIVDAIEQSKIYVPVLSENYAYSKWCLKELVEIVRRQKEDKGCIILPIFYMVDPRDVRGQTGPYKQAFRRHMKSFDGETIQNWKDALSKVGALKGWHVKSSNEQGAIADIVSGVVWSHLSKGIYLLETDKLVGIDHHVEAVKERMSLDSGGVTMVGIHGIGGIGKTTVATTVYNEMWARFDRCSFVENVRETLQQKDGVIILQKNLISNVMRTNSIGSIGNVSEGIRTIRDRISRFKVLIILDDVDEKFKFKDILGNHEDFAQGSRFIITSRNIRVLNTLTEGCNLYEVQEMSRHHSLQLFCKYAFKYDFPPLGYEALSEDIVSTAGGLPLALKVVGSLLFKEKEDVWRDKLAQLKRTPEEEVTERLKISYDTLSYEAKQIFLDIACFYIGMDKEIPSYMWSDCNFHPISNINILIQRSMIKLGDENQLQMHDQFRDMGREIVRQENVEQPWKRSRIWSNQEALDLLHNKKGTNKVKAIRLNSSSIVVEELEKECFMNLSELRYFEADFTKFIGDFSNLLPNLRWLHLHHHKNAGHRLTNFDMKNLATLDLQSSQVTNDWGGWSHIKMANTLKVLDLSECCFLTKLPDLPKSRRLERLYLGGVRMRSGELDIGSLRNLKVLRLMNCEVRNISGGTIGMLKGLQELDVSYIVCENNLRDVLADIGELPSLKILRMIGTWQTGTNQEEEVLEWMKLPASLKVLNTSVPIANLSELMELEELTIEYCGYGLEIPPAYHTWWKLSKLKSLTLYKTKFVDTNPTGPPSSSQLLLPSSLTSLHISECPQLKWLPNLENLENLTELSIFYCPMIREIQGLGGLKSLDTLEIVDGTNLGNLNGLDSLRSLSNLSFSGCDALEMLPSLAALSKLLKFHCFRCPLLAEIQGLEGLKSLQIFEVDGAESLTLVHGLGNLLWFRKLETLRIWTCPLLTALSSHEQQLDSGLVLDSLRKLSIRASTSLLLSSFTQMLHLSKFPRLMVLELGEMGAKIVEKELLLEGLESLEELVTLMLLGLASIQRLPSLSKLVKLKHLIVTDAPKLCLIDGLADLQSLEHITLSSCTSLERLPAGLSGLKQLRNVDIQGSTTLTDLSALSNLRLNVTIWLPNSGPTALYDSDSSSDL